MLIPLRQLRLSGLAMIIALSIGDFALGQSDIHDSHQATLPPENARFEIIQSELAAKFTFRLDRFTGHVWQLVSTLGGGDAWEPTKVLSLPSISSPTTPRFQIFESGIAAKFSFLIDTSTGQTWTFTTVRNKDGSAETLWVPFEQ
jgi:hypothetical protein